MTRAVRRVTFLTVAILVFSITVGASGAPAAPTVLQISASGDHTCAVMSGGGVKCWGSNWYGQLGNGLPMNCRTLRRCPKTSGIPVDVVGLGNGVKAVSAGGYHSCALTSRGGVKCWGYNATGQLGNGVRPCPSLDTCPRARSSTPVDVIGLASGVSAIAAGGFFTCALLTKGGVKCWGANFNGQLGNGSSEASSRPVDVIGLASGVSTIVAGGRYSCAVTTGGGVKCWGSSLRSIAGLGSGVMSIAVGAGATDVASVHLCALTSEGGVKCWGSNGAGQLGNGSKTDSQAPVDVVGLRSGARAIAVGSTYSCALTSSGGVKCWGSNYFGELGNGSQTESRVPVDVTGLRTGIAAITAGTLSACALTSAGNAKCWGSNYRGTLGTGTAIKLSRKPVDVLFSGKPSAKPPAPSPGGSAIAGRCSKATALKVASRFRLALDPTLPTPIAQVLCGPFVGPGSESMALSVAIPSCGRTAQWAVFRRTGGAWQLVMTRNNGADLDVVGSDIRETMFVLRPGDAHCFPTGGTRARTWHWSGTRFTVSPWKQATPGTAAAPAAPPFRHGYFKTPSGNIVCQYLVSSTASVSCGIKSGLKPKPPYTSECKAAGLDYNADRIGLGATGQAQPVACSGDAGPFIGENGARVLG